MKEIIYIKFLDLMRYEKSELIKNRNLKIRSIGNPSLSIQEIAARK